MPSTAARPVPAAVRGARVSAADVRAHQHLAARADLRRIVLAAAFPEAEGRALRSDVLVRPMIGRGGGVRGLEVWREGSLSAVAFARLHSDGIAASVIRRKVLGLFEGTP